MRTRKLRVAALSLLTLLLGVAAASATTVSSAPGTPGEVRPVCTPGVEYAEGECAGIGPEAATYDAGVSNGADSVPKSLIEPVTGSIGDVTPPPPPPPPPPPEDEGEIE